MRSRRRPRTMTAMTLSSAFTAVGSALGLLGFAVLVAAAVLASIADLSGRELGRFGAEEEAS